MSAELLKEPDGGQPTPISDELKLLREQVAELTNAVRALVKLQAIANQMLDSAIKGKPDCAVL
jgi:hypothetical protein